MAFTDHKIHAFTHKITDLADQPNLPPDELKARFDSSPEELRQAVNAICDEGEALSARIDRHDTQINQISMEKFPDDTIQEKNLHLDLAAKLNGMANQTALAAEAAAREAADNALGTRLDAVETALPQKCEVYIGSYTGTGSDNRFIDLGRTPVAVLLCDELSRIMDSGDAYGGLALTALATRGLSITEGGFIVYNSDAKRAHCNHSSNGYGSKYRYLAFFCTA